MTLRHSLTRRKGESRRITAVMLTILPLISSLLFASITFGGEIPPLSDTINDFAAIMPQASVRDLEERLNRFKAETGHTVIVVTLRSLAGEEIESLGRRVFENLPLEPNDLQKSVLLLVARNDQAVGLHVGSDVQHLFPEPEASRKLTAHVALYFGGIRPDLGIYAGVNYIFRVIRGVVQVNSTSEREKLEEASTRGAGAGAIFAVFLAPYLAFMVGALWGIYATRFGAPPWLRLFIGAVLGSGTSKLVATVMSLIGQYSDGLWFFILIVSIPLAVLGSLTEFWMAGEWYGIPKLKGRSLRRKPTEKMGI
jgi:uncharacterized membrane protein YgcG